MFYKQQVFDTLQRALAPKTDASFAEHDLSNGRTLSIGKTHDDTSLMGVTLMLRFWAMDCDGIPDSRPWTAEDFENMIQRIQDVFSTGERSRFPEVNEVMEQTWDISINELNRMKLEVEKGRR